MAYKLYTDTSPVASGDAKKDATYVVCYPSKEVNYPTKKTKVIELPKGLQFNHAEDLAKELMNKKFFTSFSIVKTIDPR